MTERIVTLRVTEHELDTILVSLGVFATAHKKVYPDKAQCADALASVLRDQEFATRSVEEKDR
jgi:hypothetical protein